MISHQHCDVHDISTSIPHIVRGNSSSSAKQAKLSLSAYRKRIKVVGLRRCVPVLLSALHCMLCAVINGLCERCVESVLGRNESVSRSEFAAALWCACSTPVPPLSEVNAFECAPRNCAPSSAMLELLVPLPCCGECSTSFFGTIHMSVCAGCEGLAIGWLLGHSSLPKM